MDLTKFKILLDEKYQWPSKYLFKFVVPSAQFVNFKGLFKDYEMSHKESKTGKFVSFTISANMSSSDEVIDTYKKASSIKGIVSL